MAGYLPDEATAQAFSDGWYRTGDVGYLDTEGWLRITDRAKEMIKVRGFQVAPAEIEAVLHGHPGVDDCAVFGVDHAANGEAVVAAVATHGSVDPDELVALVAERLASYKQLSRVVVVPEIPRLPSGKVLRRVLKEQYGCPPDQLSSGSCARRPPNWPMTSGPGRSPTLTTPTASRGWRRPSTGRGSAPCAATAPPALRWPSSPRSSAGTGRRPVPRPGAGRRPGAPGRPQPLSPAPEASSVDFTGSLAGVAESPIELGGVVGGGRRSLARACAHRDDGRHGGRRPRHPDPGRRVRKGA